jgi:ribonuclease BN (tRNA processing enzyme)
MVQCTKMGEGITVYVLGDYGPFSRMGKSIGYRVTIGNSSFLIDCGCPLFQQIGGHSLKTINSLIVTHCHDDHKRWFSDLALFNRYALTKSQKVTLLTSEGVHDELIRASSAALDRSLSKDSKTVIDVNYEEYINHHRIGPRARYRIVSKDEGNGKTGLYIMDREGNPIGPDRAKVVISEKTKRPRMLFKDPASGEWIEPESFYPFSSPVFYDRQRNIYKDREGFTIEAIASPVWHGITGIGVKIKTEQETLIFSSDLVHDIELWKQLFEEKRPQRLALSRKEFEAASVLSGDINDYIERIWSEERYQDAVQAFRDAVVIHDISVRKSIVHTDYERLRNTSLEKTMTILTHSPDKITSGWVLCKAEKTYKIKGKSFFEVVGSKLYPLNADIYHKESGRYFVGYKNEKGRYMVYEREGLLTLSPEDMSGTGAPCTPLFRVDLYEDISGKYFPRIEDGNVVYFERKDGKVERIEFTAEGSTGTIVENQRDRLQGKVFPG